MVNTAVLFITFRRPEYARQTWEAIKAAKPRKLYFYSNKGRENIEGELQKNEEIRGYITEIDWPCELHTFFREECVNVYDSIRGAISWLFSNEEEGIILEEDCVPSLAFFSFVDIMIETFRNEKKVWVISGDNFAQANPNKTDYIFSHYHWMYGWATWADRWNSIKWDDNAFLQTFNSPRLKAIYKTNKQKEIRLSDISEISEFVKNTKCWDYYLGVYMDTYGYLTVCPKEHLVTNIGRVGEHNTGVYKDPKNLEASPQYNDYFIKDIPKEIKADIEYDYITYCLLRKPKPLIVRAVNKALRIIKIRWQM